MTYIIAEIGGNHDGELPHVMELIHAAKDSGADAAKFQAYKAETLVHPDTKALPQAKGYKKQLQRFKDLEFTADEWHLILDECQRYKIDFLATCFDMDSLHTFAPHMKYIKIASGDLTYQRLLRAAAAHGKPVLLSTGMSRYDEIQKSAQFFSPDRLTVMHCVSLYPCPDREANLSVIRTLQERYRSVGYSDHTQGVTACIAAAGMGVDVIEKHFTLRPDQDFGDHPLSANPDQFAELVSHTRRLEQMIGGEKPSKEENPKEMRRGAYAARDIEVGEVLSEKDILALRPRNHRDPHDLVGTRARKDYKELECLT